MLTVINIRGTSGSGKSYIVKNILGKDPNWIKWVEDGKILGYFNNVLGWSIIGSYENVCGGCDGIKTQEETEQRIKICLSYGYNVIFEGLLISTLTSRWLRFAQEISPVANLLFCYLDTPIEECLSRVKARREAKGNTKPLNPDNTVNRVKAIETTYQKLSQAGCYCIRGSQQYIMNQLHNWFRIGG